MKPVKKVVDVTRDVVIVAREVKGKCSAGIKVGDKIVTKGANIDKEKSDDICGYAFANVLPVVFSVRMGVDLKELGLEGRLWQCVDPGPPYTAGGSVLFEIIPVDEYDE